MNGLVPGIARGIIIGAAVYLVWLTYDYVRRS